MNSPLHLLQAYQFELPERLVAQRPIEPRDHARLMVIDRKRGDIDEIPFHQLTQLLQPKDRLILNNAKVLPAKLFAQKETGAQIELLILQQIETNLWKAKARPTKKLKKGTKLNLPNNSSAIVQNAPNNGYIHLLFQKEDNVPQLMKQYGLMPIPHYIRKGLADTEDATDYQTVFAEASGALASPTAGLHFTSRMLEEIESMGVESLKVTLNVGLGTFQPVKVEEIRLHEMHYETYEISEEVASSINHAELGRTVCIGTTSLRALESATDASGQLHAGRRETNLFVYPGYQFRCNTSLLTNFHLPGSTLLMLVSAFGGYDLIRTAYQKAIKEGFRFYSYGDAMLIL
ncbi:tRNA preQ1(34) S-adenosylmethionine ribosyltransferase-isomerase QueA [Simkania negevensis]|uniref:S-adenosylmethionine:tRNA ribosyltransferase-isomerase n=1 Tax=Simkania negevensis TaxID=83561 RepID=A0ABS3APS7_9BACT|nr:tRNA preQ1(34) S-adenosylmethionine ribosyltransferase-isomerase QueA [Simkania negevensis]